MFLLFVMTYASSQISNNFTNLNQLEDENYKEMCQYLENFKADCINFVNSAQQYIELCTAKYEKQDETRAYKGLPLAFINPENEEDIIDIDTNEPITDPELKKRIRKSAKINNQIFKLKNEEEKKRDEFYEAGQKVRNFRLPRENERNKKWIKSIKECASALYNYINKKNDFFFYQSLVKNNAEGERDYINNYELVDDKDKSSQIYLDLKSYREHYEKCEKELPKINS